MWSRAFLPTLLLSARQPHTLDKRATCSETSSYTSPNGLNFTSYCDQDITSTAYGTGNPTRGTFTNCMNDCSVANPPCYGIAFSGSNSSCALLTNATATNEDNLIDDVNTDIALVAPASQLEGYDASCPYTNNSVRTTEAGLDFSVQCTTDLYPQTHYCPWSLFTSPWCKWHTETLDECMEACATARPLCVAISWDPTMGAGFGNCYLRHANGTLISGEHPKYITHTAFALLPEVDAVNNCSARTATSSTDTELKYFDVQCYQERTQTKNITTTHEANINTCMDRCAAHTGTPNCKGVVFDSSMESGYENCLLLSELGTSANNGNATYARLTSSEPKDSSSGSSSSKAWIAGPVVGGVAGIALIIGAFFWWRRRKNRKLHQEQNPNWTPDMSSTVATSPSTAFRDKSKSPVNEPSSMLGRGFAEVDADRPQYELDAASPQNQLRHELPSHTA
ncbi:hypothetical protein BDV18DRAFT_139208 [Aspergillus unguis]